MTFVVKMNINGFIYIHIVLNYMYANKSIKFVRNLKLEELFKTKLNNINSNTASKLTFFSHLAF